LSTFNFTEHQPKQRVMISG